MDGGGFHVDPAATLAPAAESVQTGYQPNDTLTIALPSHLGAWAWSNRQSLGSIISTMDPVSGIGIPVAFGAGLISFLSPCVLPLVPGYISAVAGVAPAEIRARRVLGPSLAFVASFSVIFIALGLIGQQALHGVLTGPAALKVCGAVIVVMGVVFVLAPFVPRLSREWHVG